MVAVRDLSSLRYPILLSYVVVPIGVSCRARFRVSSSEVRNKKGGSTKKTLDGRETGGRGQTSVMELRYETWK